MKDIGLLMREFNQDFEDECVDDIKDMLWKRFRKDIIRGVSRGLPTWYKSLLLEQVQAETDAAECPRVAHDGGADMECCGQCKESE
jgi:hypothetical protein